MGDKFLIDESDAWGPEAPPTERIFPLRVSLQRGRDLPPPRASAPAAARRREPESAARGPVRVASLRVVLDLPGGRVCEHWRASSPAAPYGSPLVLWQLSEEEVRPLVAAGRPATLAPARVALPPDEGLVFCSGALEELVPAPPSPANPSSAAAEVADDGRVVTGRAFAAELHEHFALGPAAAPLLIEDPQHDAFPGAERCNACAPCLAAGRAQSLEDEPAFESHGAGSAGFVRARRPVPPAADAGAIDWDALTEWRRKSEPSSGEAPTAHDGRQAGGRLAPSYGGTRARHRRWSRLWSPRPKRSSWEAAGRGLAGPSAPASPPRFAPEEAEAVPPEAAVPLEEEEEAPVPPRSEAEAEGPPFRLPPPYTYAVPLPQRLHPYPWHPYGPGSVPVVLAPAARGVAPLAPFRLLPLLTLALICIFIYVDASFWILDRCRY
eukprot:tig00020825_g14286.t1